MRTVYLIQSIPNPEETYVGVTSDFERRFAEHNAGKSPHTRSFAPWKVVVSIRFSDTHKANAFERYLKSGSGRAFANRHF